MKWPPYDIEDHWVEEEQLEPLRDGATLRYDKALRGERRTSHLPPTVQQREDAIDELHWSEAVVAEFIVRRNLEPAAA